VNGFVKHRHLRRGQRKVRCATGCIPLKDCHRVPPRQTRDYPDRSGKTTSSGRKGRRYCKYLIIFTIDTFVKDSPVRCQGHYGTEISRFCQKYDQIGQDNFPFADYMITNRYQCVHNLMSKSDIAFAIFRRPFIFRTKRINSR
jgi:hypothetical protein